MSTMLSVAAPADFSLVTAVCNYGFYLLAPNRWDVDAQTLHRPLRDAAGGVILARISQRGSTLRIACDRTVDRVHHAMLRSQVSRMLRLDESFDAFHRMHKPARRARFARLFRSPTLFEDIVKTMTSCNVAWSGTKRMNELMCRYVGSAGDFPTPSELSRWTPAKLKSRCGVGYRAERIVRLARDVCDCTLDLAWFERPGRSTEELLDALLSIHGIGPFAAHNTLQLLGRYDRLAIDTETIRHFRQFHNHTGDTRAITRAAESHYNHYAPYQFLAYWFELWMEYKRSNAAL